MSKRKVRKRRAGQRSGVQIAASAVAVLGLSVPGVVYSLPAGASNFTEKNSQTGCSNGSPVNATEDKYIEYSFIDTTQAVSNANSAAISNRIDPTSVTAALGGNDVRVRDQDYTDYCGYTWHGAGGHVTWGLTTCDTLVGSECDLHTVRYDTSYFDAANSADEKGLAVHELGHTMGLTHICSGNCGDVMSQDGPYTDAYSSHDLNHINNNLG